MEFEDLTNMFAQEEDNSSSSVIADYEKQIFDYKQLIQISMSLSSTILDLTKLIETINYTTLAQMRTLGAGMFVMRTFDSNTFSLDDNYTGLEPDANIEYEIPVNCKFTNFLTEQNKTFTIPELKTAIGNENLPVQISSLKPTLIIPLKQKNRLNGVLLLGEQIISEPYTEYEREWILMLASLAAIAINNTSLIEQTTTDMMTHLKLKTYFYTVLEEKIETSVNEDLQLSVLMLDIDFFKKFNDTYGHACGDYVLQSISKIIAREIRGQDLAGRYGGEEFVVMLYKTDSKAAISVAERIRSAIETEKYVYEGSELHVTISIGVATLDSKEPISAKLLVEYADRALYQSKENGRNRVTLASKDMPSVKDNLAANENKKNADSEKKPETKKRSKSGAKTTKSKSTSKTKSKE
ncbi:MAG: diguanylate cyclase DgcA [Treponemataceae bacterium]|nr:sensor domain-containing diguanylate cyclase [Spirochaetales bacterium]MDY6032094.1 diguanylate cyclase DgcA [Treponemataceae bacterium]